MLYFCFNRCSGPQPETVPQVIFLLIRVDFICRMSLVNSCLRFGDLLTWNLSFCTHDIGTAKMHHLPAWHPWVPFVLDILYKWSNMLIYILYMFGMYCKLNWALIVLLRCLILVFCVHFVILMPGPLIFRLLETEFFFLVVVDFYVLPCCHLLYNRAKCLWYRIPPSFGSQELE